jgi:hypothetical protein
LGRRPVSFALRIAAVNRHDGRGVVQTPHIICEPDTPGVGRQRERGLNPL